MSNLPSEMDEALKKYYSLFAFTVATIHKRVKEEQGEEGVKMLARALQEVGRYWGTVNPEYSSIKGRGAKSFAESFLGNIRYYGFKAEMLPDATEEKAVVRISFCPLHEICKDYYPDLCCNTCEPNFDVGTSSYVNSKMKLEITKKIPNGDPYCDYVYSVK